MDAFAGAACSGGCHADRRRIGTTVGERIFDAQTVAYMTSQSERLTTFFEGALAFGATLASMIAYPWPSSPTCGCSTLKKLTRGRHLWLRNNGSTLVSR